MEFGASDDAQDMLPLQDILEGEVIYVTIHGQAS